MDHSDAPANLAAVLIVDDVSETAAARADSLTRIGHYVRVAHTEADATACLAGWEPDVAIIDLDAGLKAAEWLAHGRKGRLLIALLKPESAQRFSRDQLALFDYVFAKAVSPKTLADTIEVFINRRTRMH
jgi:CheY-like chemotaxis protein